MFEYEMATARRDDLIREAEAYRLLRDAKRAHRALSRSQEPERPVREHRGRFARVA
jgi:hypothetical protein